MEPQRPLDLPLAPGLRAVDSRPTADRPPYVEIVVPALNEETRLGPSLKRIAGYLSRQPYSSAITVVDNGSVDRTADLVVDDGRRRVPVRLIGCARPGKGAAVRRGMLTSSGTYVGFCDADLSTPVETLDLVLPELERGSSVVIASRRCPGAEYAVSQPLARRMASRAFRAASRTCMSELGQVHDSQCGFKFFTAAAAQHLFDASTAGGFAFDVEILALAYMAGYGVTEVPATWEHQEGSKISVSRDATRVLAELISMRRNLHAVARSEFAISGPVARQVELPVLDHEVAAPIPYGPKAITAAA